MPTILNPLALKQVLMRNGKKKKKNLEKYRDNVWNE